jgi:hypothetical protein
MNITPTEAEENLAAIQTTMRKFRHSVASGGSYITLIVTGVVWLIGFLSTQFTPGISAYVWTAGSILGTILGIILGFRMGKRVRSPATAPMVKRIALFWLLLIFFAIAAIAIARPADGKQATILIVLFLMLGQSAMGLLFSFSSVWWVLPITALALIGYFLFPGIFYLWMGVQGGGGMIAIGLYIHSRW